MFLLQVTFVERQNFTYYNDYEKNSITAKICCDELMWE